MYLECVDTSYLHIQIYERLDEAMGGYTEERYRMRQTREMEKKCVSDLTTFLEQEGKGELMSEVHGYINGEEERSG